MKLDFSSSGAFAWAIFAESSSSALKKKTFSAYNVFLF